VNELVLQYDKSVRLLMGSSASGISSEGMSAKSAAIAAYL
jgi:hypothetical protein